METGLLDRPGPGFLTSAVGLGCVKTREIAEESMTPEEIVEAERLAREWMEQHQPQ